MRKKSKHLKVIAAEILKEFYPLTIDELATEKYKNFGILAPMKSNRDARTGDNIPSLQVVYNEIEPGKELKVWETGGLAKVPTSDKLNLVISHACSAGLRTFAANQFVVVKP
jgi:hypothetical protein